MVSQNPHSLKTLAIYSLPAIPLASTTPPLLNLMPAFYAHEVGVPLAAIGLILLSTRLLDVVTDPLIGSLSAYPSFHTYSPQFCFGTFHLAPAGKKLLRAALRKRRRDQNRQRKPLA